MLAQLVKVIGHQRNIGGIQSRRWRRWRPMAIPTSARASAFFRRRFLLVVASPFARA
jgi:hypothetical protein